MQIYIHRDGQRFGPYTNEETQNQLANGGLLASDLAWCEGATDWLPLSSIFGTSLYVAPLTSPAPAIQVTQVEPTKHETEAVEWYYSNGGERFGPIAEGDLSQLIKTEAIAGNSVVWNKGMEEWQPISNTRLATLLKPCDLPPPLTGTAVSSSVVWVLAFAPLMGLLLQEFLGNLFSVNYDSLWPVMVVLNFGLVYCDSQKLAAAGHDLSKTGSIWLIPVYLFNRAKILNHNLAYFILWCVSFILMLFL